MKKYRARIEIHRKICYNTNIKFENGKTKMTCFFNEAARRYRRIIALIAAFSAVFALNMCRTMGEPVVTYTKHFYKPQLQRSVEENEVGLPKEAEENVAILKDLLG